MKGTPTGSMADHRPMVRSFVLRHVRDETLAEDLVQETYLRVQRTSGTHRGDASERSWLCAIALNVIRDHFRAVGRVAGAAVGSAPVREIASEEDGEQALLESEMASCIGEFLLQLPHLQYEVVALHDMAGLTHAEIAAVLDVSVANSRVLLHRGRTALRALLRENCELRFDADGIPCERKRD